MNDDPSSAGRPDRSSGKLNEQLGALLEEFRAESHVSFRANPDRGNRFEAGGGGTCPDVGTWIEFATQKSSGRSTDDLLAHAALCSECLSKLRISQRILDEDSTAEEKEALSKLVSTSGQWQRKMAVELAETPCSESKARRLSILLLKGMAVAATALILIVLIVWRWNQNPERLIAEAYSQNRVFDLRIDGARYAPLNTARQVRGVGSGQGNPSLRSAEGQIEEKLKKTPADQHWLQLRARAAILDERYDEAVAILERLLAVGPVTQSLLLDAGSAYYLRGTVIGSDNDRAQALDYLRHADEMDTENAVVLFNEAIVMEDRGRSAAAAEIWNRYLKVEIDPRWLGEGRARLRSLEARLNRRTPN
jgi:tetratricopeptide (TPR) repeat protein